MGSQVGSRAGIAETQGAAVGTMGAQQVESEAYLTKIENKLGMGHHDNNANTNVTSTPGSSMTGGASSTGRQQMSTGTQGASTESGAAMTQTSVSGSSMGANSITGQQATMGSQVGSRAGIAETQGAAVGTMGAQQVESEAYLTRAEERLVVGKETVGAGVAQLHKYVTTEHVGTAVPVLKERAVIEREVIPVGERIGAGAIGANAFQEQHIAVALQNEVAVGRKEEVPIERVRLRKEVEVGEQLVEADLRKEHIEVTETATKLGASGVGANAAEKRLEDVGSRSDAQLRQDL